MVASVLRVMSLNVGSLLEPDWDNRRHEVVAWIERVAPDMVCLQEIWEADERPNTGGWVADAASGTWHHFFGGHGIEPGLGVDPSLRFGSSVLSRFPIESGTGHRLPIDETAADVPGFVRKVPWELVHVRTAGVDVFTCHLVAAPRDARHRRAQVVAIDEIIETVRADLDVNPGFGQKNPNMPMILAGDFNAEPDSDEIRFLRGHTSLAGRTTSYQDAWAQAGVGDGLTQDWRINPTAAEMNLFRKRIDYVFVGESYQRAGSAGRILSAERICDESLTGVFASDHFGLVVDIVWPQRPAVDQ